MNSIFMNQQETKTIKYLNQHYLDDQPSENDTPKLHSEEERYQHMKKMSERRHIQQNADGREISNRVMVIDRLDNNNNQMRIINNGENRPKNRHYKGKSMDIYEQKGQNKKEMKMQADNKAKNKKVVINNNYLKDLRQRNSISEINHYNFYKKSTSEQKQQFSSHFIKQKKSKEIVPSQNKKSNSKAKSNKISKGFKTNQDKSSRHGDQYTLNHHKNKKYSKSHQIKTSRKPTTSHFKQSKHTFLSEFKKNSYTMPINGKNLINIYSNNSSLYNSHERLQKVDRQNSYIIPTEMSLQLDEIRQYESMSVNIRSTKRLRKLQKISIIKQIKDDNILQKEVFGHHNSTQDIISNYINMVQHSSSALDHSLNKELQDISIINKKQHEKGSLGAVELTDKESGRNYRVMEGKEEKSIINSLVSDKSEVYQHKRAEFDLNSIINIIKRSQNSTTESKMMIVSKIKELLLQENKKQLNSHIKNIYSSTHRRQNQNISQEKTQKQQQKVEQIHESSSDALNNNSGLQNQSDLNLNSLKQSFQSSQTLQNINLQILDKTLKQRQIYLIDKKQKELLQLYENKYETEQELLIQINNLGKWMDHQIKEVVHTRKQLWKGFNLAKELIREDSITHSIKNKEMIKCISDKYLLKNYKKIKENKEKDLTQSRAIEIKKKIQKKNLERERKLQQKVKKQSKKVKVENNEVKGPQKNRKFSNSDVQIDISNIDEQFSDDQLLDSSGKLHSQHSYNEYNQKIKDQSESQEQQKKYFQEDSDDSISNNKFLSEATELQNPIPNTYSTKPPSIGLNLQKVECQIEQEDSFTEQELMLMAKESLNAKNESMMTIPKSLSLQDKQDIYEFIFLDLCIQLTDEYNQESSIMKKIQNFITNIKEQSKKQKGFKTNANVIKEYLFQFITFLKNKPQLLKAVHLNLDKPLGPTAIDILKYMHVYDDEQYEDQSNQNVFILDIKLFQKFQEQFLATIAFEKYYYEEEKQQKRIMFLKNAVHIHNKAIFDALNEILDKHRPYGVWGEPFSWKTTAKFYHLKNNTLKNNVILQSIQKIIDNSSYMCGFMLDKEDCNLKSNPNITQAYIDHIRQDRLSRMLANELDQFQEKMLFMDDQETQILVEIGHMIYQSLVNQSLSEIHRFMYHE